MWQRRESDGDEEQRDRHTSPYRSDVIGATRRSQFEVWGLKRSRKESVHDVAEHFPGSVFLDHRPTDTKRRDRAVAASHPKRRFTVNGVRLVIGPAIESEVDELVTSVAVLGQRLRKRHVTLVP